MRYLRRTAWFVIPPVVSILGRVWIETATTYFERQTGRELYGLAGYHYSVPEWGFKYHEGGQYIERWAVTVPTVTTLVVLLLSALTLLVLERRRRVPVLIGGAAYYLVWMALFLLIAGWYYVDVIGMFI